MVSASNYSGKVEKRTFGKETRFSMNGVLRSNVVNRHKNREGIHFYLQIKLSHLLNSLKNYWYKLM